MDRRYALARGETLPDRTHGAALFADISGFTRLTAALVTELGVQRGPEELTAMLNRVYTAVIDEVHAYGGSVIAFAGDAITCWFDDRFDAAPEYSAAWRATAAALAIQRTMAQFATVYTPGGQAVTLAVTVAVATGPARRFLVGDAKLRIIDALAGRTLERLAMAEKMAEQGEVLVDEATLSAVGETVTPPENQRVDPTGERFAVITQLAGPTATMPWPSLTDPAAEDPAAALAATLSPAAIRPWLLAPVYERLQQGRGDFLAELRPTVALFLRFGGINFDDDDEAGRKLDAYIRWVQQVVGRFEGTLIDLNIGDKGSYLYINFGAPLAHEDNAARAANAALVLRDPPPELDFIDPVQIGISQGRMRAGAYGGDSHRTYGVLGNEVNMAARLMMAAAPGQIFMSITAQQAIAGNFVFESLPPLAVKGRQQPLTVFRLEGVQAAQSINLPLPAYNLPLVGREAEARLITEALDGVLKGEGQVVAVTGAAGLGKSRLIAEAVKAAQERGFAIVGSECESHGINSSYLVWKPIWRELLGVDATRPVAEQVAGLQESLAAIDPSLVMRQPLLTPVLDIPIPQNELTQALDAKLRKTSLEALLVDCLRQLASQRPLLVALEDCHWLDQLSFDLLEAIGRAIADRPVLLLISYRPRQRKRRQENWIDSLPTYREIQLHELTETESAQLMEQKVAQLSVNAAEDGGDLNLTEELRRRIIEQAEGNPFYVEELINYLHFQGAATQADLPDSLHQLVLSRLDQLGEDQKSILKVASVIGRVFHVPWLYGTYPELGDLKRVQSQLRQLTRQEITQRDYTEPELAYLFKQLITQSVAYESLPFVIRATMHEQFGQFIERTYPALLEEEYLDLLAYHYGRSENKDKQRTYFLHAGDAAQANYAIATAIDYYQRALPLLPGPDFGVERVETMLKLGQVLELDGQWEAVEELYAAALETAEELDDPHAPELQSRCEAAMGELLRKQGRYDDAADWLERARANFEAQDDRAGVGQALHYLGTLAAQQGEYEQARERYERSLTIRQQLDDKPNVASLLSNLGILARFEDDYARAQQLYEESLSIRRLVGDRWAIANSLNNLGLLARYRSDFITARTQLEESLEITRLLGDKWSIANTLTSLAEVALDMGDTAAARACLAESLEINRTLGEQRAIAFILESFAALSAPEQPARALRLAGAAAALRDTIGAPLSTAEQERLEELLEPARAALSEDEQASATAAGQTLAPAEAIREAMTVA